jgi:hypothetical protein
MKETKENKGLGIASMVLGIMGLFGAWIPILGLPVCVLGLTLGLIQKNWTTSGIAITGVSLNSLWVGIQLVWATLFLIGIIGGL